MTETESRSKELIRGEELFSQGSLNAAKEIFLRLVSGPNPCMEALNNLGVIAFQEDRFDEAVHYFTESLRIDPLYEEAVANYSQLQEAIKRSRSGSGTTAKEPPGNRTTPGNQTPDRHEATSLPGRRARIAVLCLPGLETFLGDIVKSLQCHYEVRTCYSGDGAALESAARWADLIWLEWGNQLAVYITQKVPAITEKKVICRVHRYEVFQPFFKEIQWQHVDQVLFVAGFMRDLALKVIPDLLQRSDVRILYNGIHLNRFRFVEREPGYNLAVVGYIHSRKNPYFWPMILSELKKLDRRYTLHIAGQFQEPECQIYLEHMIRKLNLDNNIKFHGYQKNIHQWLEDKQYLLATSIHESFGYSIGEAMAMGIRPVVNWFPGAEELWPKDCLFTSIEEAAAMVKDSENYDSRAYRRFVEERYSLPQQMIKIEELINSVMESDCSNKSVLAMMANGFWEMEDKKRS